MNSPVRNRSCLTGLTLVELLVVIAIIGILAALLLPVLGKAKSKGQTAACLNNLKQLQLCWELYVNDHNGFVPPNLSEHVDTWRSTPDSWIGRSSAPIDGDFNPIEEGLLFKYDYNRSVALYRCPSDTSKLRRPDGVEVNKPRTRSYSMSGCLGGRTNEVQNTVNRADAIPSPSTLFVFIDEHEDSIDDAHFLTWPDPDDRWVNMPTDRHNQSGTLSFADGHVEAWKWQWPKTFKEKQSYWKRAENESDLADLRRLQTAILPVEDFVPQQ
jgi:prepilin-type N-terminal cleavage/methylation domain-containing protein/prepilin-type processing-associated H-X9-DG protein